MAYLPMLHKDHVNDLRHFRVKSKSWSAGDKPRHKSRVGHATRLSFWIIFWTLYVCKKTIAVCRAIWYLFLFVYVFETFSLHVLRGALCSTLTQPLMIKGVTGSRVWFFWKRIHPILLESLYMCVLKCAHILYINVCLSCTPFFFVSVSLSLISVCYHCYRFLCCWLYTYLQ